MVAALTQRKMELISNNLTHSFGTWNMGPLINHNKLTPVIKLKGIYEDKIAPNSTTNEKTIRPRTLI